MLRMAVGHSDEVDPRDAIDAVVAACRDGLDGGTPQAGVLFAGFEAFDPLIVGRIREAFPGIHVVGTTSAAELSSAAGYGEDSITLAVLASDTVSMTTGLGSGLRVDADAACRAAVAEALDGATGDPKLAVVLTDAFSVDPPRLLDALALALPPGVGIVGGASARADLDPTAPMYQLRDERVTEGGLALLLLSGPLAWSAAVGTGWKPVGPEGTVTGIDGTALTEIDGRPAAEFVMRYLDATGPASFGNPIAVYEDGAEQPYLRVALGGPTDGAIALMGSVPLGARIQITTTDPDDLLGGATDALQRATAAFPPGRVPSGALLFSCAVRRFLLGSRTGLECGRAEAVLGPDVPYAGPYCNGEIGPVRGVPGSRFLNETFVAVLLGT